MIIRRFICTPTGVGNFKPTEWAFEFPGLKARQVAIFFPRLRARVKTRFARVKNENRLRLSENASCARVILPGLCRAKEKPGGIAHAQGELV